MSEEAISPGASYYRARYYDPSTGRFPSEDPIMFLCSRAAITFTYIQTVILLTSMIRSGYARSAVRTVTEMPHQKKARKFCKGAALPRNALQMGREDSRRI